MMSAGLDSAKSKSYRAYRFLKELYRIERNRTVQVFIAAVNRWFREINGLRMVVYITVCSVLIQKEKLTDVLPL